jgi:hypothetical protein
MALLLSIETEFGVPATYWRVSGYMENFKPTGTTKANGTVIMDGFANQAAASVATTPMATKAFEILGEDYIPEMDRVAIYNIAKKREEFAGAKDA